MSIQFFQTIMGKHFYEGNVPRIAGALARIADALEKQNELAEALHGSSEESRDTRPKGVRSIGL